MASATAYADVKTALEAAVAPVPVLDWDAVDPEQQQGDVPWISLEEDPAEEVLISVGDPSALCNREQGEMTVHVFVIGTDGLAGARTLADQARAALRHRLLAGGTRVLGVDPAVPGILNDGRWSSAEFSVQYQFDTFEDITT